MNQKRTDSPLTFKSSDFNSEDYENEEKDDELE